MAGPEAFRNPFDTGLQNGNGSSNRTPAAIGSGRGRAGSVAALRADGHSPNSMLRSNDFSAILMRKLPTSTTRETLRSMLIFSRDCTGADLVPSSRDDEPFLTAIARFKSSDGANQARDALHGKSAGDGMPDMIVDVISLTPGGSVSNRRFLDAGSPDGAAPRQSSRFSETFNNLERTSPPQGSRHGLGQHDGNMVDGVSPTFSPAHTSQMRQNFDHSVERQHNSGRSMIQEDGVDDETHQFLQDPGSYMSAERQQQFLQQGRRATAPHIPVGRFANLSINSNVGGGGLGSPNAASGSTVTSPRSFQSMQPHNSGPFSPLGANGMFGGQFPKATSPVANQYPPGISQRMYHHPLPPVNPADQNPPCNTLYVGNLPMDTSEDELKALFSKQRGYRRLCFRMKSNGPMCFVEFEDVSLATRALKDLYGVPLSNSVRGGIRLSFSKNPLGVRNSNQQSPLSPNGSSFVGQSSMAFGGPLSGFTGPAGQAFSTASGPPPGLPTPQGFGSQAHNGGSGNKPTSSSRDLRSPDGAAFNGFYGR